MERIVLLIKSLYLKYRQLFLYGIIGSISAGLDFCVYSFLCFEKLEYLLANVVGVHFGMICSFVLNRHYNFKVKDKTKIRFFSFYIVALIGLSLSSLLLYILISCNNFNRIYSKLITIFIVAILQFLLNKFITFKRT